MKTTVDLPDALARELKLRAVSEGRKLKDLIADLLRQGLDAPTAAAHKKAASRIYRDKRTGLPVIRCTHPAAPGQDLTPDRVAQILLDQEVEWHRDAGR